MGIKDLVKSDLKRFLGVFVNLTLSVLCVTLMVGCAQTEPISSDLMPTPLKAEASAPKKLSGADLFAQNCASCHGISGKGNAMMMQGRRVDFTATGWQKMMSDAAIKETILYGKGAMPAFADTFSEPELNMLVQHIRAFKAR